MTCFSIYRDPSNRLLLTKWLRTVNSQEYRASLLSFYQSVIDNQILYWIVDVTRISSPDMPDQKWTIDLLGPGICDTHLKRIAFILPDDLFLEVVTEKMADEVLKLCEGQVEIAYFRDYEQAFSWLHVFLNIANMHKEPTC